MVWPFKSRGFLIRTDFGIESLKVKTFEHLEMFRNFVLIQILTLNSEISRMHGIFFQIGVI